MSMTADAVAEVARLYRQSESADKAVRGCAPGTKEFSGLIGASRLWCERFLQAARALDWPAIVDALRANEWVSVKDRLPDEENDQLLVAGMAGEFMVTIGRAYFEWKSKRWHWGDSIPGHEENDGDWLDPAWRVTHWRPLPLPPSQGQGGGR